MRLEQREPVLKVVSVSNNVLLLLGLRRILERHTGILVVGESSWDSATGNVIAQQRPDVILVDIESDIKSAQALHDLRQKHPSSRIIVLSGWDEINCAREALAAQADAIFMKFQQPGVLLAIIEYVGKGPALSRRTTSNQPPLATKVGEPKGMAKPGPGTGPLTNPLTDREQAVVRLVGQGLSNREIANNLCIAETTVRHHLTSIFDKLNVSSRQKLLIRAQQCGLVELLASA